MSCFRRLSEKKPPGCWVVVELHLRAVVGVNSRASGEAGVIFADRCIQCGTCVAVCPSNSLGVNAESGLPEQFSRLLQPEELGKLLGELKNDQIEAAPLRKLTSAWDRVWVFWLIGLIFGGDWYLRRRWGLA